MTQESYSGVAVFGATVAHKFRLWTGLYILLPRFPLFYLFLHPEGSHPLATHDTTINSVVPAVSISSKRLSVVHVNACKLQIALTDILKAQYRATYWATSCSKLTIQEILGYTTVLHSTHVSEPAYLTFAKHEMHAKRAYSVKVLHYSFSYLNFNVCCCFSRFQRFQNFNNSK